MYSFHIKVIFSPSTFKTTKIGLSVLSVKSGKSKYTVFTHYTVVFGFFFVIRYLPVYNETFTSI